VFKRLINWIISLFISKTEKSERKKENSFPINSYVKTNSVPKRVAIVEHTNPIYYPLKNTKLSYSKQNRLAKKRKHG